MQRRTALAAAAAITMSVTSGVVAIGANTGLFGLSGGATPTKRPAVVLTQSSVTTGVTGTAVATTQAYEAAAHEHEGDDGHEAKHQGEHDSEHGHDSDHESDHESGHERESEHEREHEREHAPAQGTRQDD
ncbi:MAG: hypothetical protein U0V73_14590 [Acidimicrobiia bacterium]